MYQFPVVEHSIESRIRRLAAGAYGRSLARDTLCVAPCAKQTAPPTVWSPPEAAVLLAANPETRDETAVAVHIIVPGVVEQATTSTDELHQSAARVVVTFVQAQVLGEVVNTLSENRDLDLGRTRVGVVKSIFSDCCRLVGHG